jgi:hypothetical protein
MRKDDERKLDHATLEALCGCHRDPAHMTLAMLALAFLAGLHARLRPFEGGADRRRFRQSEQKESLHRHMTESAALVAISVRELGKLLTYPRKQRSSDMRFPWDWSIWRRQGQTRPPPKTNPSWS